MDYYLVGTCPRIQLSQVCHWGILTVEEELWTIIKPWTKKIMAHKRRKWYRVSATFQYLPPRVGDHQHEAQAILFPAEPFERIALPPPWCCSPRHGFWTWVVCSHCVPVWCLNLKILTSKGLYERKQKTKKQLFIIKPDFPNSESPHYVEHASRT